MIDCVIHQLIDRIYMMHLQMVHDWLKIIRCVQYEQCYDMILIDEIGYGIANERILQQRAQLVLLFVEME